jgi:hypothetical protein
MDTELPDPGDPVLRAAVETLRELPPENPAAVDRIVASALVHEWSNRSFKRQRMVRYWRRAGAALAAAALFGVGFWVGHRNDAASVATAPSMDMAKVTSKAEDNGPLVRSVSDPVRSSAEPGGTMFRIVAPRAEAVALVGDFNAWNPTATPLERTADGQAWTGSVMLTPGRHTYAFVVDGVVTPDPNVPSLRDPDYDVEVSTLIVKGGP